VQQWLFQFELPETIIAITASEIFIVASGKKIQFLKGLEKVNCAKPVLGCSHERSQAAGVSRLWRVHSRRAPARGCGGAPRTLLAVSAGRARAWCCCCCCARGLHGVVQNVLKPRAACVSVTQSDLGLPLKLLTLNKKDPEQNKAEQDKVVEAIAKSHDGKKVRTPWLSLSAGMTCARAGTGTKPGGTQREAVY